MDNADVRAGCSVFDYDPANGDQRIGLRRRREPSARVGLHDRDDLLSASFERGAALPPTPPVADDPDALCLLACAPAARLA
ncbi:hypothetical protein [Streptomyces sp. KL116D]|uniref:hypothetical protein n=1 Tax=Streptomyces sp. KL116D TaxID=3045152 RepID=UPI003556912F